MMENLRPNRDEYYKAMLDVVSTRGTCLRAKQGALILREHRVIVTQYNGALPGQPHCTTETCNATEPCKNSVHAEEGAIVFAAKKGIPLEGTTMWCTTMPCPTCARLIVQAGIKELIYTKTYRLTEGIDILTRSGVKVRQYGGPHIQDSTNGQRNKQTH